MHPMAQVDGNAEPSDLIYGLHAIREALRAGTRPLQRILVLRTDRQFGDLVQTAKQKQIPVHIEPSPAFDRLVPNGRHQGVIAFVAAKSYDTTEQILDRAKTRSEKPFLVLLDGVEDPHNLGAVLRTAEAAGVHGVFIPERRAVGLTSVVAKVSAGALDHISVGRVGNLIRLIQDLKEAGLWIYGVAPQAAKLHTDIDMTGPIALVLGGEGEGLRPGVLKECDDHIRIPMQGRIQSLNVSAAAAITLFEVVRQRRRGVVPAAKPTGS
jgi:23S rRNA (guanosine2251-2'-O)-methyltransferase